MLVGAEAMVKISFFSIYGLLEIASVFLLAIKQKYTLINEELNHEEITS